MNKFIHNNEKKINGVLHGFDRLVLKGIIRCLSYSNGMLGFLCRMGVLLKDFGAYVEKTTKIIRNASYEQAKKLNRPIKYLHSNQIDKEEVAKSIQQDDNITQGLICKITCVEPCSSFNIVRDPEKQKLVLESRMRKCLHIYDYYIHPIFGFMSIRLQTWFPFNIQICINGREWLSKELDKYNISYKRADNCFPVIDDIKQANTLMQNQLKYDWISELNKMLPMINPVHRNIFKNIQLPYYWMVHQSEWATDIMFNSAKSLANIYPNLILAGIVNFNSHDIMRFLGKKLHGNYQREIISDYKNRQEGVRIKHKAAANSIKMYDKAGNILRIETTINNPVDLKSYRRVENKPESELKWRPLRKNIIDIERRAKISQDANERYLDAIGSLNIDDPINKIIDPVCKPVIFKDRKVRALHPWAEDDISLIKAINHGEFFIFDLLQSKYPQKQACLLIVFEIKIYSQYYSLMHIK